jgi:hypothetical protein
MLLVGGKHIAKTIVDKNGNTRTIDGNVLPDTYVAVDNISKNQAFYTPNYFASPRHPGNVEFIRALTEATTDAIVSANLA